MPNLEKQSGCHFHSQQIFSLPLSSSVFGAYIRITLWQVLCSGVCVFMLFMWRLLSVAAIVISTQRTKISSAVNFEFHGLLGENGTGKVQKVRKAVKKDLYALFGLI